MASSAADGAEVDTVSRGGLERGRRVRARRSGTGPSGDVLAMLRKVVGRAPRLRLRAKLRRLLVLLLGLISLRSRKRGRRRDCGVVASETRPTIPRHEGRSVRVRTWPVQPLAASPSFASTRAPGDSPERSTQPESGRAAFNIGPSGCGHWPRWATAPRSVGSPPVRPYWNQPARSRSALIEPTAL